MYITVDDIKNEIFFYDPFDNRNGDLKSRTNSHLLCFQFL